MNFKEKIKKELNKKQNNVYDVGIVGWWYNENYGGILTYYALQQAVRKMGYTVLMVDKLGGAFHKSSANSIPRRFASKYYQISPRFTEETAAELNKYCKAFISGSDQLFNPTLWQWSGPEFFLSFVSKKNNLISYASSFGNRFNDKRGLKPSMASWLRRFDSLSAREDYGVEIFKEEMGLEAQKVTDPVFLCDAAEYGVLADSSGLEKRFPYLLSFFLDPDPDKREAVIKLSEKLHLKYINLIDANKSKFEENIGKLSLENTMSDADVEEWLFYYKNADFIITDSFHGSCFSIIFKKPFISIANKQRGVRRFESMLNEVGLTDRLVYDTDEIFEKEGLLDAVDYERVDKVLKEKSRQSFEWLYNAVENPPAPSAWGNAKK